MTDVVANCVSDTGFGEALSGGSSCFATWEVLCQPRWQIASVATSSREHALLQIPVNYICDNHYIYSY